MEPSEAHPYPLICPKARGHASATLMHLATPPPPMWTGWARRPRPPHPGRTRALPQPTCPLALSQSMVNTKPEKAEEDSEEAREQKHKTFVEKYEKQIKHFGKFLRRAPAGSQDHRRASSGFCNILPHRHAPPLG